MYLVLILIYLGIVAISYIIYKDNCRYIPKREHQIAIAVIRILGLVVLFLRFFFYYLYSASLIGNLILYIASFYIFHVSLSFLFYLARKIFKNQKRIHGIESLLILLMVSFVLCMFSFEQAILLVDKEYYIYTDKEINMDVTLISDLHLGNSLSGKYIDRLVEQLNDNDDAMILIAGDLYDEATSTKDMERFIKALEMIDKPIYYVRGNHEVYSHYDVQFQEMLTQSDVNILDDSVMEINGIAIVGRKDKSVERESMDTLVSDIDEDKFTLVMDHHPIEEANDKVDLQVSGHTHNGQILPFNLITKLRYPDLYGYYDNAYPVVVTSGCGTWGIPMRLGTNSEIIHLHIKNKDA